MYQIVKHNSDMSVRSFVKQFLKEKDARQWLLERRILLACEKTAEGKYIRYHNGRQVYKHGEYFYTIQEDILSTG